MKCGVCGECIELGRDFGGRQRKRISVRARTPSGIQLGFREGGEKEVRQRERISARARTPSGDTTKIP